MVRRSTKALEEALGAGADAEPSVEQQIQDKMPVPQVAVPRAVTPVAVAPTKEVEAVGLISDVHFDAGELKVTFENGEPKVSFHGQPVEGMKRLSLEPRDGKWVVRLILVENDQGGGVAIVHKP